MHPKYENLNQEWENQEEVIKNGPTPVETKLHTSPITMKALMLKAFATIIKKQEPHLIQDLLYAYHLSTKGKHK